MKRIRNACREKAAEAHIENAVKLNEEAAKKDPKKALDNPKVILANWLSARPAI